MELTSNERKVLKLMCAEKTLAEIAKLMDYNIRSIERFKKSLLQKTNSKTVISLFRWAVRNKLATLKK